MVIFRSLKSKFIITLSLLLLFIFVGQSISDIRTIETRLRNVVNQEAEAFSNLSPRPFVETYDSYYVSGFSKFKEIVEDTCKLTDSISRVRLIDMEGRVRFDTKDLKRKKIKELETIEPSLLDKARKLEPSYIYKDEKKNILSEIINPFVDEWGRHQYSLIYTVSYEAIEKEVSRSIMRAIFLTLLLLILSVSVVNFLIIRITGPLLKLQEGARIVGGGNLDYKLKIKTGDEIEEVAHEFNKMTERLKESRKRIEEAKELLEVKVKERTKELQERIDELERFQKLTVGRELKMVELKKEIKKLREELEKQKSRK